MPPEQIIADKSERDREFFRVIALDAPMGIAMVRGASGSIDFANETFAALFGYERDEIVGMTMSDVYVDPAERERIVSESMSAGTVRKHEARMRRRNGTIFWALLSLRRIDTAEPAADAVLVIAVNDITELKFAQNALSRHTEELSQRIKELRCLYAVSRLVSDTSRPVETLCGEIVKVLPGGWRQPDLACARLALYGSEYVATDCRPTAWGYRSRLVVAGQEVGTVEVGYRDVPDGEEEQPVVPEEQELLDNIALHISQMLERRDVTGRLAQSQRLEVVGQLTGGIAHDFNNLLTVLFGNLEVAQELAADNEPLRSHLSVALNASGRAAELTSQLLAFSRRQRLAPTRVDVNQLIARTVRLMRRTLGEAIDVKTKLAGGLREATVDPVQLESAILNMALNARDAMPDGGELTLETSMEELDESYVALHATETLKPGAFVRIVVADTGCGMPPEVVDRAFEPFFTTKDIGKGSGLGLSMVYGFVTQSGGHVKTYSVPGEGTTFHLYLPVAIEGNVAGA